MNFTHICLALFGLLIIILNIISIYLLIRKHDNHEKITKLRMYGLGLQIFICLTIVFMTAGYILPSISSRREYNDNITQKIITLNNQSIKYRDNIYNLNKHKDNKDNIHELNENIIKMENINTKIAQLSKEYKYTKTDNSNDKNHINNNKLPVHSTYIPSPHAE